MPWRTEVRDSDREAIINLVADTGFFTVSEQAIAIELVDETLTLGTNESGYSFVLADSDSSPPELLGYSCYGAIPDRPSDFDLYWIVVAPKHQGNGIGRDLMYETEVRAHAEGATQLFIETSGRHQYAATRVFYERLGYRLTAKMKDFYAPGDAKIIYKKNL